MELNGAAAGNLASPGALALAAACARTLRLKPEAGLPNGALVRAALAVRAMQDGPTNDRSERHNRNFVVGATICGRRSFWTDPRGQPLKVSRYSEAGAFLQATKSWLAARRSRTTSC